MGCLYRTMVNNKGGISYTKKTVVHASKDNGIFIQTLRRLFFISFHQPGKVVAFAGVMKNIDIPKKIESLLTK